MDTVGLLNDKGGVSPCRLIVGVVFGNNICRSDRVLCIPNVNDHIAIRSGQFPRSVTGPTDGVSFRRVARVDEEKIIAHFKNWRLLLFLVDIVDAAATTAP